MIQVIRGLTKAYDIERNKLEKDLENASLDIKVVLFLRLKN